MKENRHSKSKPSLPMDNNDNNLSQKTVPVTTETVTANLRLTQQDTKVEGYNHLIATQNEGGLPKDSLSAWSNPNLSATPITSQKEGTDVEINVHVDGQLVKRSNKKQSSLVALKKIAIPPKSEKKSSAALKIFCMIFCCPLWLICYLTNLCMKKKPDSYPQQRVRKPKSAPNAAARDDTGEYDDDDDDVLSCWECCLLTCTVCTCGASACIMHMTDSGP